MKLKTLVTKLDEVLKKSDPTDKRISDFVNSKDSKFSGKTKKERINEALAAYYAKQKRIIASTNK